MLKSKNSVQDLITDHIYDINRMLDNMNNNRENKIDLLQAKSTALVALAELVSKQ